ncbi:MAG: rhomboid family intramembrane serine protease, partial [Alphaproteobacteria bacterium]|nr:rhomboid family intramembrane serine protease [Alphaproteobacteria bacterium]
MLLPLHDRTPVVHIRFQVVTSAIIVACTLAFIWQLSLPASEEGEIAIFRLAFVPARLFGLEDGSVRPDILWGLGSIATSMFLHAGLGHIFGNMLFLWVFGDNI